MDNFINEVCSEISLPCPGRQYTFLHISDSHINAWDELSTDAENEKARQHEKSWDVVKEDFARHYHEPFGDEHRIPSTDAFAKMIGIINEKKPDMLLMSGDMVDFIYPAALRFFKKQLEKLCVPYMFVPGNHEGDINTDERLWPFTGGSDIQVKEFDGFSVVGINDCGKTVSDTQLAQLTEYLDKNIPTIVMMHIPVVTSFNREKLSNVSTYFFIDEANTDKNGAALIEQLKRDNVKLLLCGHVHGMNVSEYAAGKTQFCASSAMAGFIHRLNIK